MVLGVTLFAFHLRVGAIALRSSDEVGSVDEHAWTNDVFQGYASINMCHLDLSFFSSQCAFWGCAPGPHARKPVPGNVWVPDGDASVPRSRGIRQPRATEVHTPRTLHRCAVPRVSSNAAPSMLSDVLWLRLARRLPPSVANIAGRHVRHTIGNCRVSPWIDNGL